MHQAFAEKILAIIQSDPRFLGLAAAGSWITDELDAYSDLDLVLITTEKIGGDVVRMEEIAKKFGKLLSAFTGEHVGEPRLLICMYDDPLLHVDLKFLLLPEFSDRVEDPVILWDRDGSVTEIMKSKPPRWPWPGHQWIEDRFWTWVHYVSARIGRGEYFEAIDGLNLLRSVVLGPLLQVKYGMQPRGVRRLESKLPQKLVDELQLTIPAYDRKSVLDSLSRTIEIYRRVRNENFPDHIEFRREIETASMHYFDQIASA